MACVATVFAACSDPPQPTAPQIGTYPLRRVDGLTLPATRPLTGGCTGTYDSGRVHLTASLQFSYSITASHACPTPGDSSSGDLLCAGIYMPGSTTIMLSGTIGGVPCRLRVTGYGDRLEGQFSGPDSAVWRNPAFDFGPRSVSP